MKAILVKVSSPGWKKEFDSLAELFTEYEKHICKSCTTTESEYLELLKESPTGPSTVVGMTMQEEYDNELADYVPDDWKEWPTWSKIQLLDGTSCGCEFDFYVEDK